MQLGINLGYWGAGMDADNLEVAKEADRLGYAVCWAAEAYGSDVLTPLAWWGSQTKSSTVSPSQWYRRADLAASLMPCCTTHHWPAPVKKNAWW